MKTPNSSKVISINDLNKLFPSDDACLAHLMKLRYGGNRLDCPKCKKRGKFSRIKKMPAFQCAWCGHHIHPMAGTLFQDTRTPLKKWVHALYLFTTTRNGVSAKELERYIDVPYKTAWRIGRQIKSYMAKLEGIDASIPLTGIIEIDETYIGGKKKGKRGRGAAGKIVAMGMLEKNGRIRTHIVEDVKSKTLLPIIEKTVRKGSTIHTDELRSYCRLAESGFIHKTVHHGSGEYARNGIHVNGLEGFWSQFKRSVRGTYVSISRNHALKYLAEFQFRYNMRNEPEKMFSRLMTSF